MAKSVQKITLSQSRDIPFNRLVLSQSNVRRIKAGVSIEELAEDIARRTLLQSITVRPMLNDTGAETGMFEIPAGGRRYRALELLVKQKRLSRTAPIPCVVRTEGIAEEDSLAENIQRAPLHPLDQFRAFLAMREKGMSEEEIAAAFFVSINVVKQRLKLASISPKLLDVYADDGMTLEQLMAFTVNPDHERQDQVWEALQRSYTKEPHHIRRLLTEGAVRASDKRARFVGIEAYEAAGGIVLRDLFEQDGGGWLQDPVLLDRLVADKLEGQAEAVRAEGWKWVEVAIDFPYGHNYGWSTISGEPGQLTDEDRATQDALRAEYEQLEATYAEAEELPNEIDQRLGELEAALATFEEQPLRYDPKDMARAGAFVSIDSSGALRVERGYVRPEDEPVMAEPEVDAPRGESDADEPANEDTDDTANTSSEVEEQEDDGIKPLPDRLLTELTAHRTLALRQAVGEKPDIALVAILHALCLKLFYHYGSDSCLEVEAKSVVFANQALGLNDTAAAKAVDERHRSWSEQLPEDSAKLWNTLLAFDVDSRHALLAHCVALTVNAMYEPWNRRPRALAHADRIAEAVNLDMASAGWTPTVDNYFGRVTKVRILEAVREAKSDAVAQHIEHLKKGDMAEKAQELLAGTCWLPEPLRTPDRPAIPRADGIEAACQCNVVEKAVIGEESAVTDSDNRTEDTAITTDTSALAAQ